VGGGNTPFVATTHRQNFTRDNERHIMEITPMEAVEPAGILPMTPAGQYAAAGATALARAGFLLNPVGIPEDPPAPDIAGARVAFQEAVEHLTAALDHAGGRPGHRQIEAALEEAQEALMHLAKPGINPPIAAVVDHAWRGGELARTATAAFEQNPDAWIMTPPVG
jgi:hypothetical protein